MFLRPIDFNDFNATIDGFGINDTIEFRSSHDVDGHGTHTASITISRHAFQASMAGYAAGIASKARIATYKVCWKGAGCLDFDILADFDCTVTDGIDIISISISSSDGVIAPYYLDPIAVGSYGAVSKGFSFPSLPAMMALAPCSSLILPPGSSPSVLALSTIGPLLRQASVGVMIPLVYPSQFGGLSASLCMENSVDPKLVNGKIVICDRSSSLRMAKGMVVKDVGGAAMILAHDNSNSERLVVDTHVLPTCAVGSDEGDAIKAYASSTTNPTAMMAFLSSKPLSLFLGDDTSPRRSTLYMTY
ncbi:subtilisin-like protease SBT1.6 [Elaeis guineensis]|uniref:subtilisin-like protease SBT1.6 n=1 Tax=Elaeis guineensis var. tenera TaxID=51953 RepID=UPI003C6D4B06